MHVLTLPHPQKQRLPDASEQPQERVCICGFCVGNGQGPSMGFWVGNTAGLSAAVCEHPVPLLASPSLYP